MSATCPGSGRKGGHFGQLLPDRIQPKIINKMQTHHSPCDIRRATWDHNALNPQDPLLPMPRGHVIVRHAVTLHLHGPATTKTQCAAAGAGWQGTSRILPPTSSPLVKSYPMVCQKVFRVGVPNHYGGVGAPG